MNLFQSSGLTYVKEQLKSPLSSLLVLPFILLTSCSEQYPTSQQQTSAEQAIKWAAPQSGLTQRNFSVLTSEWYSTTRTLNISGTANNNSERIRITNADTGEAIATTVSSTSLYWSLSIKSLANVPCRLAVTSESGTLESVVVNAPVNCNAGSGLTLEQSSGLTLEQSTAKALLPNAIISSPETDLSIEINQTVNFEAAANIVVGTPRFKWNFNGVAQNSTIQNPGEIQFSKPGVYHITLDVSDSQGNADPSPAMRMITVFDPISILTAQPIANIDTPTGDQVISIGTTLNFTGSGSDPASNEVVTFLWDFDGAAPNSATQNPGDVTFETAGVFNVVLSVSDSLGNIGTFQVSVTVNDPNANQAPTGMITSPASDVTIAPGDSIVVEGSATDPDGNDPVTYLWGFDGVADDSTVQNPGSIMYPEPGIYTIQLTATDSMGLADINPPVRVITVQAGTAVSGDLPVGEILTPEMDITIAPGDSVTFTGTGSAATGNEPLMFLWSFDGVAENSAAMDAGSITFPDPGVYVVTLLVIDAASQIDPTPAVRIITVQAPDATAPIPTMPAMVGHIVTPETDVNIIPGEAVSFSGTVNPELNPPYSYLWLFDGAASNSSELEPGSVVFTDPGVYSVMFFAIDNDGVFDSRPAIRMVTATDPADTPIPAPGPIANIILPIDDISITVGDVVTFEGSVVDVSGNNTLEYLWTFGGAAPDDMGLTPVPVIFETAGTYEITFTATDTTTGLSSAQPASIIITVNDQTPLNPNAPVASIISPAQASVINAGDSINFEGDAIDTSGNGMLAYLWTFENAAPDSDVLSPGSIVFDMPGEYDVTFNVIDTSDSTGLTMASATVSIIVLPVDAALPASPLNIPNGIIVEPALPQTINVGGTIQFSGEGINPTNNGKLKYAWDFGNGSTSTAQVPGMVTFNQVGTFTVTLTVSQSAVHIDPTPAEVIITVVAENI